MTRSQRLVPLIRLARDGEQRAARELGDSRRRLDEQHQRLSDLKDYRADYARRLGAAATAGLAAGELRRYQSFLARLDEVIALQARQVERASHEFADSRRAWTAARARHRSLEEASARHRREEHNAEDRREQQLSDDHAGRLAALLTGDD